MDPNVLRLAMGAGGSSGPEYKLYVSGRNNWGQLGLGNTTNVSSPTQVGALTDWSVATGGNEHSLFIKTDGTLWACGLGTNGQLGGNNTSNRSSPIQIGSGTTWSKITAGFYFSAAIKTDGTLWTWGANNNGQLAQGNTSDRQSPVQVGALTDWSKVSAGASFCAAVKTDGTLWTWGSNIDGNLGLNDLAGNRSSPVQVGSGTTWSFVSADRYNSCFAIKTDGTLWAWGSNYRGQLGLGDSGSDARRSSPVQVGSLTNWSKISSGNNSHTIAIKTDGTLWAWGRNAFGQLGLGNTTNYSSPVQVGSLTNWSDVKCGAYFTIAKKTDGTIWSWGAPSNGALGLNTGFNILSPMQIGSLSSWENIGTGRNHSLLIANQ